MNSKKKLGFEVTELHKALVNTEHASDFIEANNEINEMRRRIYDDGDDPEEILQEYGLEPDYFFDLF